MGRRISGREWYVWASLKRQVLERDGYECQIRAPGCLRRATEVDHIVPLYLGGPKFDPDNLRAACYACNRGRRHRWRPASAVGPSREW